MKKKINNSLFNTSFYSFCLKNVIIFLFFYFFFYFLKKKKKIPLFFGNGL